MPRFKQLIKISEGAKIRIPDSEQQVTVTVDQYFEIYKGSRQIFVTITKEIKVKYFELIIILINSLYKC